MALSIHARKTIAEELDAVSTEHKARYLSDLGFWEVEIGEILATDLRPFSETWCFEMQARKQLRNHHRLVHQFDPPPRPKKKPSFLPWSALACSGLTGILGTYPAEKHPLTATTAGIIALIGLALFVRWIHSVFKRS